MKLLVLVNAFDPDRGGGAAVYSDMCYELAARGNEVTVLAPVPFYPEWKDKCGKNGLRIWRYKDRGVAVHRFGMYIPRNPRSFVQRLLLEASLTLSMLRGLRCAREHDVIMVYCPQLSNVVVGAVMKRLYSKPVWLNVQDTVANAALGALTNGTGKTMRAMNKVETFLYNQCDVWSTISPVMRENLLAWRRHDQELILVPNWTDKELLRELEHTRAPRTEPGYPPKLLYAGNIGAKQNLKLFCRKLQESDVYFTFRIFGDGGAADELRSWIERTADQRFSFGPFLDVRSLAEQLAWADFYVVTEKEGAGASFFPSKLVAGMAAGTPILAVCEPVGPLGREMRQSGAGPTFEWNEIDEVPRMLAETSSVSDQWNAWRSNALGRFREYDRNRIIDSIEHRLNLLAKTPQVRKATDEETIGG